MDNKKNSTIYMLACFLILGSVIKCFYNKSRTELYKDELELPSIPQIVDFQKPISVRALLVNDSATTTQKPVNATQQPVNAPQRPVNSTQRPVNATQRPQENIKIINNFQPIVILGVDGMNRLNLGYNWLTMFARDIYNPSEPSNLQKLINKNTNRPLFKDKWISILKFLSTYLTTYATKNKDILQVRLHKEINRYLYFLDNLPKYNVPSAHDFSNFDKSISILDMRQYKEPNKIIILYNIFEHIKAMKINDKTYDEIVESAEYVHQKIMKPVFKETKKPSYYI